jgi:hypothetical protein
MAVSIKDGGLPVLKEYSYLRTVLCLSDIVWTAVLLDHNAEMVNIMCWPHTDHSSTGVTLSIHLAPVRFVQRHLYSAKGVCNSYNPSAVLQVEQPRNQGLFPGKRCRFYTFPQRVDWLQQPPSLLSSGYWDITLTVIPV